MAHSCCMAGILLDTKATNSHWLLVNVPQECLKVHHFPSENFSEIVSNPHEIANAALNLRT